MCWLIQFLVRDLFLACGGTHLAVSSHDGEGALLFLLLPGHLYD